MPLGLLRRGYREPDVRKIMGLNWLHVYEAVWDQLQLGILPGNG